MWQTQKEQRLTSWNSGTIAGTTQILLATGSNKPRIRRPTYFFSSTINVYCVDSTEETSIAVRLSSQTAARWNAAFEQSVHG